MLEPIIESETNQNHTIDPFKSVNDQRDHWKSGSFGARARRTAENSHNFRYSNGDEGVQFRPLRLEEESGIPSPPLWKTSPPRNQPNPAENLDAYQSLSPTSRTQAIARGQKELMEMVKDMPESCYELSLKDLVEHRHQPSRIMGSPKEKSCLLDQDRSYDEADEQVLKPRVKSLSRQECRTNEKKSQIPRNGRFEKRDLFLKTVFPVSFRSRKKKKNPNSSNNTSANSRVSPKPEGSDRNPKTLENDWWKKKFSGSSESESGMTSSRNSRSTGSSGSTSTSTGRKKRAFFGRCLFPK